MHHDQPLINPMTEVTINANTTAKPGAAIHHIHGENVPPIASMAPTERSNSPEIINSVTPITTIALIEAALVKAETVRMVPKLGTNSVKSDQDTDKSNERSNNGRVTQRNVFAF